MVQQAGPGEVSTSQVGGPDLLSAMRATLTGNAMLLRGEIQLPVILCRANALPETDEPIITGLAEIPPPNPDGTIPPDPAPPGAPGGDGAPGGPGMPFINEDGEFCIVQPDGSVHCVALTPDGGAPGDVGNAAIELFLDGGGSKILNGTDVYATVPFDCVVRKVILLTDGEDVEGNDLVVEIYRSTVVGWPPNVNSQAERIGLAVLDNADSLEDTALNFWTDTALKQDDSLIIRLLTQTASVTKLHVTLRVEKAGGADEGVVAGGGSALIVQEIDGDPLVGNVRTLKVTNGALTDDTQGVVTLDLTVGNHAEDHASRHERAGADELDGDHLDIDFTPSNYVPSTAPAQAANVDDLAAHLKGIDTALLATFREDVAFSDYIETNARITEHHLHGELALLASTQSINSGGGFNATIGISRIMLVVLAGSDTAGTITLTGTSVDRDDGTESGSDTEELTIAGLTTDGSDTDAASNTRHSFTKAYVSTKWWRGSVAFTTSDVDLSDVDVYSLTFDQFDGERAVIVDALDITFSIVTGASDFFAYMYSVVNTGTDTWDITRVASVGDVSANLPTGDYRLRRANLAVAIDGISDGIFITMFPASVNRFEDMTIKIWTQFTRTVTLGV